MKSTSGWIKTKSPSAICSSFKVLLYREKVTYLEIKTIVINNITLIIFNLNSKDNVQMNYWDILKVK